MAYLAPAVCQNGVATARPKLTPKALWSIQVCLGYPEQKRLLLIKLAGDGSYGNPAQMATALANKDFKQCHVYYVPFLKKYFRYTDECVAAGM